MLRAGRWSAPSPAVSPRLPSATSPPAPLGFDPDPTTLPLPSAPVYENPLLSFSSLPAITDAFLLSRYVSSLCVPGLGLSLSLSPTRWLRGAAEFLRSSISWRKPASHGAAAAAADDKDDTRRGQWKVASVWSECGDIAESESFDGFIVGVLDHTLHIQLAPSLALLHGSSPAPAPGHAADPSEAYVRPAPPPSLFHIQLRMLSVFQFNEAGRIVFQRDHWDVRDLVESIVPGAGLAGAVGRWAGGLGLRLVGRVVGGCGPDKGRRSAAARRPTSAGTTTPAETARLEEKVDHHAAAGVDSSAGISSSSYPSSAAPFPASAPMTTFHSTTSTGGTVSPLSPTLQLRQFRSANGTLHGGQPSAAAAAAAGTSMNPSSLTSPTLAAAQLATTPTRATRQRRGTTSSRSWGSSGARSGSISFPTAPAAATGAAAGSQKADGHGVLGLDFHPTLAAGLARAAAADDSDGRALDHAP